MIKLGYVKPYSVLVTSKKAAKPEDDEKNALVIVRANDPSSTWAVDEIKRSKIHDEVIVRLTAT